MAQSDRMRPAEKSLPRLVRSMEMPRIAGKNGVSSPSQSDDSTGILIATKKGNTEHSFENRMTNHNRLENVAREKIA